MNMSSRVWNVHIHSSWKDLIADFYNRKEWIDRGSFNNKIEKYRNATARIQHTHFTVDNITVSPL